MVIMASGIARGRVRTESRNMAAMLQKENLEKLTVRLGPVTIVYFSIFRQARPDFL